MNEVPQDEPSDEELFAAIDDFESESDEIETEGVVE